MNSTEVVIIGAGPYGLSVAAHLAAANIPHRIFGTPMQFWAKIAGAADGRFLKSYCFGTSLSTPKPGFTFADHNAPRGLETFEPCSMKNFADYGRWFQQNNVPWVEQVEVERVTKLDQGFSISLANGEQFITAQVVVATGLANFARVPSSLSSLDPSLVTHTTNIHSFAPFQGKKVAVLGAGQSALEACALLHEAGAFPILFVRETKLLWHWQVPLKRSLWRRLRSPISGLGTGPKAWVLTNFPGAMARVPEKWRVKFVKGHLPAEGAWWLRQRFEGNVPVHFSTEIIRSENGSSGEAVLSGRNSANGEITEFHVDHVVAGTGYTIDLDRLKFLDVPLQAQIERLEGSPKLNLKFESSVPGLRFVGTTSAMSFGPLFRFVVGAEYTAKTIAQDVATQGTATSSAKMPETVSA